MAQFLRPAIAVALYALLLPVFGPMLDHHFVEWQHNHGHIYFANGVGDGPEHRHLYQLSGGHRHPSLPADGAGPALPEETAYLTTYDGAGAGLIYAPHGPTAHSLCFPDPEDGLLLAGYTAGETRPSGALTAPPWKPPRT